MTDTPIREQSALELLETHAKALSERYENLLAEYAKVVTANAEVAKLNVEQAETIERLRAANAALEKIAREAVDGATDAADEEMQRLRTALERINMLACYASEENTDARAAALLEIGKLARGETPASPGRCRHGALPDGEYDLASLKHALDRGCVLLEGHEGPHVTIENAGKSTT